MSLMDNKPLIDTKVCQKCNEPKEFIHFNKRKDGTFGLNNWCKQCQKIYNKERYAANRDYFNNKVKQWHENNPEKNAEYQRNFKDKTNPNRKRRPRIPPAPEIPDEPPMPDF